jgi:hypothetical protein
LTRTRVTQTIGLMDRMTRGGTAMLEQLAGCSDGQTCPAVFAAEDETVLVRGDLLDHNDVPLGAGEAVVRLPASMLAEAAKRLQR